MITRNELAQLAVIAGVVALLSSCSQGGGGAGTITMPSGMCAENPSCCDANGNFNASTCSTTAGSIAAGAISQAQKAGEAVAQGNTNALHGGLSASTAANPNSGAATAALGSLGATGGDLATTALSSGATTPSTSGSSLANSGSGSAGGAGAHSAGGSFGAGGTTTSPATVGDTSAAAGAPADQALDGVGAAMTVAGSRGTRGGAMGDGSANPFGGLFDTLNGDKGAARNPAAEMKFRGEIDPLTGKPTSASADPADYFTRLTANDSLFKVVERRYQQQAINWAKQGN